jgi:hypothetical protein
MTFSPEENITYALSKFNFKTPGDTNITFDFNRLKTSTVNIEGVNYALFKLVALNISDFQSMYFNKPTIIKTNTDNLFLEMVYIPNQECVQAQIDNKESPQQIINGCNHTNIRYDYVRNLFETINLVPNQQLNVLPPEKLDIQLSKNNINHDEYLTINYFLNNSLNQKIKNVYIHQLWDQNIMPQYTFVNSQNQISYQTYPFSNKPSSYFKEKLCLPPEKYQVQASFPLLLWGKSQLLNNVQDLNISSFGNQDCQPSNNNQTITPANNYLNWEDLYQNRNQLYSQSTGYLQTFPKFGTSPNQLDIGQTNYVNQCSDLETINNKFPIIIDLNQNNTFSPTTSSQFKTCLQKYVAKNYQKIFLLRNSFTKTFFASEKSYVFYYYYLLLHQNKTNQVGVMADVFSDIFYGFPEFYLISSDLQNKFLPKETLQKIIADYQLILDQKIIFYQ